MPRSRFPRPNFYAGVPLDRADRLRADAGRLAALLADSRCRVVPLWRNQHLIAAEAEAVILTSLVGQAVKLRWRFSLQVRMDVAGALGLPPPLPMFNYAELLSGK